MMKISDQEYDIVFIGHVCYDEVIQSDGQRSVNVGGAAIYGAVAAAKAGQRVAAVLMCSPQDRGDIAFLTDCGIDLYTIDSEATTRVEVSHPSGHMDERRIVTLDYAGVFEETMIPELQCRAVHLAGCNDHEFTPAFIAAMRDRGYSLSADMQSFVRRNDPKIGQISFGDDPDKQTIMPHLDKVKMDVLEARLLTGTDDLDKASAIVQSWGCAEVVVTRNDGVLARIGNETYFAKFTNRGTRGRTGRGDTTFGAYLAWRVNHSVEDAVKFAAALVSLKMEKPGPFAASLSDVFEKMQEQK